MNVKQQEFIQDLVKTETRIPLLEFFKTIHSKFYPEHDLSFMEYFLELTEHEGEFCVHHKKLIEYGIVTSKQSWVVKDRLNALGLVEGEEYSELQDILELRPQGGTSIKKVYMLTPDAFKTCLRIG